MSEDLTLRSTDELLQLLDNWRGSGNYRKTGEIIEELRQRRQKENGNKQ